MIKWAHLSILLSSSAFACEGAPSYLQDWFGMNHEILQIRVPAQAEQIRYAFQIAPNQDLHLDVHAKDKVNDELMLISGTLLSKGAPLKAGVEIDAMDVPGLTLQLVNQLLAAAVAGPPSSVKKRVEISHKETKKTLCVSTMSASGEYPPPWQLKGNVTRKSDDTIAFELTFDSLLEGKSDSQSFSGEWQRAAQPVVFRDDMPLAGWKVYGIGPIKRTEGNATILDYGASPDTATYATLGELRKKIAADAQSAKKPQ